MPLANWRNLLLKCVTNHDELQVLLLLRARAHLPLKTKDTAKELGLSERACSSALERLQVNGLASASADGQSFKFAPTTVSLERDVEALELAYRTSELAVIRALNESALQRLRASAALAFPGPSSKPKSEK